MKTLIAITAVLALSSCTTLDSLILSKTGTDDPSTPEVDESIEVNPMVEGVLNTTAPLASGIPFGGLVYSGLATALGAYAEIKRRKAKDTTKAVAIAVEKIVASDLGQQGAALLKKEIKKKAEAMGVEKELNKIVKEIS